MPNFNSCYNCNPINRFLWFFNPRIPLSCNHYTCGCNLAIFNSLAQIESCLTGVTNNCKCLSSSVPQLLRDGKTKHPSSNIPPNKST